MMLQRSATLPQGVANVQYLCSSSGRPPSAGAPTAVSMCLLRARLPQSLPPIAFGSHHRPPTHKGRHCVAAVRSLTAPAPHRPVLPALLFHVARQAWSSAWLYLATSAFPTGKPPCGCGLALVQLHSADKCRAPPAHLAPPLTMELFPRLPASSTNQHHLPPLLLLAMVR